MAFDSRGRNIPVDSAWLACKLTTTPGAQISASWQSAKSTTAARAGGDGANVELHLASKPSELTCQDPVDVRLCLSGRLERFLP